MKSLGITKNTPPPKEKSGFWRGGYSKDFQTLTLEGGILRKFFKLKKLLIETDLSVFFLFFFALSHINFENHQFNSENLKKILISSIFLSQYTIYWVGHKEKVIYIREITYKM